MKKVVVGLLAPIVNDPTSFYRGAGPYSMLAKQSHNLELLYLSLPVDWPQLQLLDILILQRPAMPEHFQLLCDAKDLGIPVIVDMDDHNLAVPRDNPTYGTYQQLQIKDAIIKIARNADALVVTTQFMKKNFGIYNKNTHLIPNCIDDRILPLRQIPPRPRDKKILWRGNASHQRNLMTVAKELVDIAAKYPDWRVQFFGVDPIDITDNIKNSDVIGAQRMIDYYKVLVQCHASVLFYPLAKTDHAQARSHISWLEGTFAGSQVLAYKNDEFNRPGCLNYETPAEFLEQLEAIITGQVDIEKNVTDSWAHILENYLLSKVNNKRADILTALLTNRAS